MNRDRVEAVLAGVLDELADAEHVRWAHWQKHLHSQAQRLDDGSLVLPSSLVQQWERQIVTPYAELSEAEKESDREQVRRYLPIIVRAIEGER